MHLYFPYFHFRYKTDGSNRISKIFTPVSTGKIEDNKIIASMFGRRYRLYSTLFHKAVSDLARFCA
jgi:hypothetical protein